MGLVVRDQSQTNAHIACIGLALVPDYKSHKEVKNLGTPKDSICFIPTILLGKWKGAKGCETPRRSQPKDSICFIPTILLMLKRRLQIWGRVVFTHRSGAQAIRELTP